MKRSVSTFLLCIVTILGQNLMSQNKGFNYQAIAHDAQGNILAGTSLQVQIGILDVSNGNQLIWQEQHNDKITGDDGSFNLVIGDSGAEKTGGIVSTFYDINWATGEYVLNIRVNAGNGFVDLGNAPLNSVPYAKTIEDLNKPLPRFTIQNDGKTTSPGEALFEVRREDGRPIFAVYEDSVWVYTDTAGVKGVKGGFAVGGYRNTSKGNVLQEYMRVTPDSVRIYIDNASAKGVKGGFAVGGYRNNAKGNETQYLTIEETGVNVYTTFNPVKSVKEGVGFYGINPVDGTESPFLMMTPYNNFVGFESGLANTGGQYNTFIGFRAGVRNTTGSNNLFLGLESGHENSIGNNNIFLGIGSGRNNKDGNGNVFLGYNSGFNVEGNNLLVIENSAKDRNGAMFFGDFNQDILRINASMGINREPDTRYALVTDSTILANVEVPSDARYKTDIETLDGALDMVMDLRGVSYNWNRDAYPEKNFSSERQIGFIAQEMETVLPEFVGEDSQGYKAVAYQKVTAVLVEAMKEQQRMITDRDQKILELEQRLEKLEKLLAE